MVKDFFKELSRVLSKHDIETAPPERNALPILINGRSACHVEPSGYMCIFPGDIRSPEASELYHKVAPFSMEVREYLTAIERAPLLEAEALDEDFRLLAEFNGTVLAGRETEYGYMFVTWQRDYKGTGVEDGEYYLDGYAAAKADFAIRSGLVEKQRLFSDAQLLDIYQGINDTFDAGYDLTPTDQKNLIGIQSQIEGLLPDIREQIASLQRVNMEAAQEQSM
ncbi:hypothetical protein Dhaf_2417 [Desulfitobacterium hafniense DCB-2]|uniref:Uncharacterized protein n=1 Tax=Desulfitobacterium hafniense (strain DSM 10664 / DCB-2) TaxID=272564 RepID=B8FU31_DESHD|nr:hypothetical protein [Desulfitobacterium hafniense]ACL20445.1 hypothetical protein Dhaf_2417 [Desulfitobacterium hafniense DCB-2]